MAAVFLALFVSVAVLCKFFPAWPIMCSGLSSSGCCCFSFPRCYKLVTRMSLLPLNCSHLSCYSWKSLQYCVLLGFEPLLIRALPFSVSVGWGKVCSANTWLGAEGHCGFYTYPLTDERYITALRAFNNSFVPKVNIVGEWYKPHQYAQRLGK